MYRLHYTLTLQYIERNTHTLVNNFFFVKFEFFLKRFNFEKKNTTSVKTFFNFLSYKEKKKDI